MPEVGGGRSGDGFMRCGDGQVRWGVFGAAGVVFVHRSTNEVAVMPLRCVLAPESRNVSINATPILFCL